MFARNIFLIKLKISKIIIFNFSFTALSTFSCCSGSPSWFLLLYCDSKHCNSKSLNHTYTPKMPFIRGRGAQYSPSKDNLAGSSISSLSAIAPSSTNDAATPPACSATCCSTPGHHSRKARRSTLSDGLLSSWILWVLRPIFRGSAAAAQNFKLKWQLLSAKSKILLFLFSITLGTYFALGIMDWIFHSYRDSSASIVHYSNKSSSFTVIINTYKRPKMLQDAVQHYAETCGTQAGVSQVFIIWAEVNVKPPQTESFFSKKSTRKPKKNRASVKIVQVEKDSLNSRFLPIPDLQTDAIFMVDDDVRVDCKSLKHGFHAWQSSPNAMVGYYPRLSIPSRRNKDHDDTNNLVYHSWPIVFWKQKMNFILTKASFLHRKYMDIYSSSNHPQEVKDYVDKYFNCEDVAMSLLVANATRSSNDGVPIYVEGNVVDKGLFGGISTGTGHMLRRSSCLRDLTKIYHKHGWSTPLDKTFDLRRASWVQHFPGFRFQMRPSNFFEWFALENIFQ